MISVMHIRLPLVPPWLTADEGERVAARLVYSIEDGGGGLSVYGGTCVTRWRAGELSRAAADRAVPCGADRRWCVC